jgi:dTDP-4-dehydrorhamnose 3,5-epimerase-like enzyme
MQRQLMANTSQVCDPARAEGCDRGDPWRGIRASARQRLETRDYSEADPCRRLATSGLNAADLIEGRPALEASWIPGVELFQRKIHQQLGRGHFGELIRTEEGVLNRIGLMPKQWASAMMHRGSAKGFHIHPPHVPENVMPETWFRKLFLESADSVSLRPYHLEQWDVMFFLTGICEMILIDERVGLPRRIMRFLIDGDSRPGRNNAAVVIPAGVGHALRNVGDESLIMVYGTSTSFNPAWEGRIESEVERSALPEGWEEYLSAAVPTGGSHSSSFIR